MTWKIFALALSVLLTTATTGFAQSQRNYGPSGPATGDTFGEPYSGSAAARRGMICPIPVITIISTGIIRIIGITGTGIADARSR